MHLWCSRLTTNTYEDNGDVVHNVLHNICGFSVYSCEIHWFTKLLHEVSSVKISLSIIQSIKTNLYSTTFSNGIKCTEVLFAVCFN